MNLLINETDFKNEVPLSQSFEFEKIKPELKRVQIRMMKWILGPTLLDSLAAAYADGTPGSNENNLLEYVHSAIANLSVWKFLDKGNVSFGDNGLTVVTGDDEKSAPQWLVDNTRKSYGNSGLDALEDLIEFLEDNSGIYSWNSQNTRELFLSTAIDLQQFVDIKESRLMYLSLIPIIRRIENNQIKAAIGTDLFEEIKTEILTSGEPSTNNLKLMADIQGAIAHFAYADYLIENSFSSDEQGFHLLSNLNSITQSVTPAEQSRLRVRRDHHIEKGNIYLQNLEDFLFDNADDYTAYKESDLYVEDEEPTSYLDNNEDSPIFPLGI